MDENFYIAKTRKLLNDQDYYFLRGEGLKHIEQLASDLWTDYNTHDPGITIMEVLCYAITELGYRTSFDIKDLMADSSGVINTDQAFFSAKEIFRINPLTINDYRKLLADIVGVKNAFIYPYRNSDLELTGEPEQEVPVYADCKKDRLVYELDKNNVTFRGLYSVSLDLEESDEYGDLNSGNFTWRFPTRELNYAPLQLLFPGWNEIDFDFVKNSNVMTIKNITKTFDNGLWTVSFDIDDRFFSFQAYALYKRDYVLYKKDIDDIKQAVETQFANRNNIIKIFRLYKKKMNYIIQILNNVKMKLHAHRNLCEDFVKIGTICREEISFCADIEINPDADAEEVYANILFQIENYLNPEIKFYLLEELLGEGISTDEIFEGPVLEHGFIKTEELENTMPRTKIYVSDIINFIMDTEGVISVKNVLLTKYDNGGKPILPSQQWCMDITNGCKPYLNINQSKVIFFKGKLPFLAKVDETLDTIKYLHGKEARPKLKGVSDDLEMPSGTDRELSDYVSVQYEFPVTYGIGEAGLASSATNERKAQAKQLKAYLMFYDQLLANFFSQLANAKELFSLNKDIKQTYFAQYLDGIKGMDNIYNDTKLNLILNKPEPDEVDSIKQYRYALLEDKDLFFDRRNRFLDHLIARFAETFNDYALMMYSYESSDEFEKLEASELINDKINFLINYPEVSSERGKAFDYMNSCWIENQLSSAEVLKRTKNVSGLEKRVSRLAGIDNFSRRFLFCIKNIEILKTESFVRYRFKITDENGNVIMESINSYQTVTELNSVTANIPDLLKVLINYTTNDASTVFTFDLMDDTHTPIAKSKEYSSAALRDTALSELISNPNINIRKKETAPELYTFKITNEAGDILLKSLKEYDLYSEIETVVKKIPESVKDISKYTKIDSGTEFKYRLNDSTNTAIAESIDYSSSDARDLAVSNLIEKMQKPCPGEGMHLVEHILLRPRFAAPAVAGKEPEDVYKLFQVCLDDCIFCGEEDPYSFRLSLILPYWHKRFESMEFRRFFESMIRTEVPAHCTIKICWINNTLMNEFEIAFKEWLEALAEYEKDLIQKESNRERLMNAGNAMIDILQLLHSEYPEAHLHDCEEGDTNPVILGSTVLGTYKD